MAGPSAGGRRRKGPRMTASIDGHGPSRTSVTTVDDDATISTTAITNSALPQTTTVAAPAAASGQQCLVSVVTASANSNHHHRRAGRGRVRRTGNGGFSISDPPSLSSHRTTTAADNNDDSGPPASAPSASFNIVRSGIINVAGTERLLDHSGGNGGNNTFETSGIIDTTTTVPYNNNNHHNNPNLGAGHSGRNGHSAGGQYSAVTPRCIIPQHHGDSTEGGGDDGDSHDQEPMDICNSSGGYGSDHISNYANSNDTNSQQEQQQQNDHGNSDGATHTLRDNFYLARAADNVDNNTAGGSVDDKRIGHGNGGLASGTGRRGAAGQRPAIAAASSNQQRQPPDNRDDRQFNATAVVDVSASVTAVLPGAVVSSTSLAGTAASTTKVVWRRREQQESTSTEGSLRAMLNKLAPSQNSLDSLATQVAGHLLEDEAPEELARQLVDRAQLEPMYAATYARLCSVLVRVRSGYVFYKHLMLRCRSTFAQGVRALIVEPMEACDDGNYGTTTNADAANRDKSAVFANDEHHQGQLQQQHQQQQQQQQRQLYQQSTPQDYPPPTPQRQYRLQQTQQNQPQFQQHRYHQQQQHQQQSPAAAGIHQLVASTSGSSSSHGGYNPTSSSSSNNICSGSGSRSSSSSSYNNNNNQKNHNNYPTNMDLQRHRLKALVVFLCHLFIESQLTFDRLYDEYLKILEVNLPNDDVALECICSALSCAGQAMEGARPQWVLATVHQLQAALRPLHEQRKLRMIFMVQDLVEMHQRNWQPREPLTLAPASRRRRDQAEP